LIYHSLKLVVVNIGKRRVKDLTGLWDDGREKSVEEYGMEYSCEEGMLMRRIHDDFESMATSLSSQV
jgi:hypothetical protein